MTCDNKIIVYNSSNYAAFCYSLQLICCSLGSAIEKTNCFVVCTAMKRLRQNVMLHTSRGKLQNKKKRSQRKFEDRSSLRKATIEIKIIVTSKPSENPKDSTAAADILYQHIKYWSGIPGPSHSGQLKQLKHFQFSLICLAL